MLSFSGLDVSNYDNTLIGWESQNISGKRLGANGLQYCAAESERSMLLSNLGWRIYSDSFDPACLNYCGCNPETAPLIPNTAAGLHVATEKCDDGDFTHYCDSQGRLLISIDAYTAANIPVSEVEINIIPGVRYYEQYCANSGGLAEGECFITEDGGSVILCRTWDVNSAEQDAVIRYYFDQSDIDLVNQGIYDQGLTGFFTAEQMWFYKVVGDEGHIKPEDLMASDVSIIDYNGTSTISETNWILGETPTGYYAEYLVGSFSGGGGGGAEEGSSPVCPSIKGEILGGATLAEAGPESVVVNITGGVGPYTVGLSNGLFVNDYNSGDVININITETTMIKVQSIVDANNCPHSLLTGMADFYISSPDDTETPVVVCQDITVNLNVSGQAMITAEEIDNGSFDFEGDIASYVLDQYMFDCSNGGSAQVTLTVTDQSGNSDTCTATVTILDPLGICCPAQRDVPFPPSDVKEYQADMLITSDGTVKDGDGNTNIIFQAGNEIDLQPGFEVELGAEFEAVIDPCENN